MNCNLAEENLDIWDDTKMLNVAYDTFTSYYFTGQQLRLLYLVSEE